MSELNLCTKTISLNQKNISLIYVQRKNFLELKKVLLFQEKFYDPKKFV